MAIRTDTYLFTRDAVFTSPSHAASVILGRNANGRIEWKDKDGRTLRDIQTSEANQKHAAPDMACS